jgi:chromosome segregation ATPase
MSSEQLSPGINQTLDAASELQQQIDALSLRQALVDFELANARVLDLTARLVEANERIRRFAREADAARCSVQAVSDDRDRNAIELAKVQDDQRKLHEVIRARDSRVDELVGEIASRDAVIADCNGQLATIRASTTFRVAAKLGSLKRRLR